jgi:hypothetical protein
MPRRKIVQLPGELISVFLIELGGLEAVTAEKDHLAPMKSGFLLGRGQ